MMLPGLRSRWTIPWRWALSSASAIWIVVLERPVERQRPLRQPLGQRLALQVLHHQEVDPVLVAHVVDRADMRVAQAGKGPGLALESLLQVGIVRDERGEDFEGDDAIEAGIPGFVDLAHPARPEGGLDLIRAKSSAGRQAHRSAGIIRPERDPSWSSRRTCSCQRERTRYGRQECSLTNASPGPSCPAFLQIGPLVFGPSDRLLTCVEPAGDWLVGVGENLRLDAVRAVVAQLAAMPAASTVNLPEQLARLRLPGSRWFPGRRVEGRRVVDHAGQHMPERDRRGHMRALSVRRSSWSGSGWAWFRRTNRRGPTNLSRAASRDDNTIKAMLKDHGIEPAPERGTGTPWTTFLAAHWDALAAADCFTVEVLTVGGLVRYVVFFVMNLKTRTVEIAWMTSQPNEARMTQLARNLTDARDGFLRGVQYVILDRDPLYTTTFRHLLRDSGAKPLLLPARSPNLNAFAERFVGSIKGECLDRIVPLGEAHLRTAVRAFVQHYHEERPHQGLGNEFIAPKTMSTDTGPVRCRERLGGVLKFYYREAA